MKTLLVVMLTACGCSTRTIQFGGATYSSSRFGTKETITSIELHDGGKVLKIRGYSSDQVEALGVVTEAAVSAAMKGAKP